MTFAVERLSWRFESYRKLFQACSHGGVSPLRFLTVKPERLRIRFGESTRQTQVPVVFAEDLADRLGALLPSGSAAPPPGPLSLDRDALRRTLAFAQLDGDLDVFDVMAWRGNEALLKSSASFYARVFEEARSSGAGEETAALFQLIAHSSIRNVLLHRVGASERFLGLAALVAYLDDRALTAAAEQAGDGVSARLGLLLVATCSPLSIMGAAAAVAERPGNAYRTVPSAHLRARRAIREVIEGPGAADLIALRAHLAAELLVDPARRRDVERSMIAEAVRDLALLSTLTQGSELRDLAGSSSGLTDALFTPLGPQRLQERLAQHPARGKGPLGRLSVLADAAGAMLAGGAQQNAGLGSLDERANLAATGALVLALDEIALEQGAAALAAVRPVPAQEAREAREDGRAYWFGFDDAPLYLMPRRRDEAFFFVDMKDFTRRTAAVRADSMGDFLARRFYNPILRMCGHVNRNPGSRVSIVNLLGDAVAARGDVASMVELSVFVLKLVADAAEELARDEAALTRGADEVLAEIELELARVDEQLAKMPVGPERVTLERHRREVLAGREQRLARTLGGGLEGSAFVAYGPQATVIEVGSADVGDFQVTIAEDLNLAARGTGRSAEVARRRVERRQRDEQLARAPLIDPFRVFTSSDPQQTEPSPEFHSSGAALTREALAAYQVARKKDAVLRSITLTGAELTAALPGYWFPRTSEDFVLANDARGARLIFRRTGRTNFKGFETRGTEVWEVIPVEAGFGRALADSSPDPEAPRALTERVVEAFKRCLRAFSFYDPTHPAALEFRRELEAAISGLPRSGSGEVIIAASGERLFFTGEEEGLFDESAQGLSQTLIERCVVGLTLIPPVATRDVDVLLACITEAPERLRTAGGVARVFAEREVRGIVATEIDFESLHAAQPIDPTGLDPLIAKAMTAALVLKGGGASRATPIQIAIARVETPDSLGSLLDELIDGAAPGVATGPPVQPGREVTDLTGLGANELAEACARGYGKVAAGASSPEVLTEAAKVLSAALVRLSPLARLKLLQRIADQNGEAASGALGREVPDPILLSAISQAVMGGARDSRLASAVGSLLERMRPIERDRQKLIGELDRAAAERGRPLDALFLQELGIGSTATNVGPLDLPFRETRPQLIQAARLRLASERQPDIVTRTFASLRPESGGERRVRLYCAFMKGHQDLDPDLLEGIRDLFRTPAQDPSLATSGGELARALWSRALQDGPASPAASQLLDIVGSETGEDWCLVLLRELRGQPGGDTAKLLFTFISSVVTAHPSDAFRKRLTEALDELDPGVQWELEKRINELPPGAMTALILRAGKHAPLAALALVRSAMRTPSHPAKQSLLRALVSFPSPGAIELLGRAAGAEGDAATRTVLQAKAAGAEVVASLQSIAVQALGASHAPDAASPLQALLFKSGQEGNQRLCALAARALAINATPEAQAALAAGRRSQVTMIRTACEASS